MDTVISWGPVALALLGTGFTFLCTAAGSGVVFFFKDQFRPGVQRVFLGFAAGVMIAASIWSLLIPGIDMAEARGDIGWVPAAGGFLLGGLFLFALDHLLPHLHLGEKNPEGPHTNLKRSTLLVFAVTLHNVPEGLAVGLSFGLAAQTGDPVALASAIALTAGMGIQNFPEGAAISLPLRQEGLSRGKSFVCGILSGAVEPVAGVAGALLVGALPTVMPWLLAFAAGAMIFVVVEELIPEAHLGEHSHAGTFGVMAGFVIMMILDVALG
jgi:ZIP family zinc transporter